MKTLHDAMDAVVRVSGFSAEVLRSSRKTKHVARARATLFIVSQELGYSLGEIGAFVGGRHHSTVCTCIGVHMGRLVRDEIAAIMLGEVRDVLADEAA